jgi:hypothetical protein
MYFFYNTTGSKLHILVRDLFLEVDVDVCNFFEPYSK